MIVEESDAATDPLQSYREKDWERPEKVTGILIQSPKVDQALLDLP